MKYRLFLASLALSCLPVLSALAQSSPISGDQLQLYLTSVYPTQPKLPATVDSIAFVEKWSAFSPSLAPYYGQWEAQNGDWLSIYPTADPNRIGLLSRTSTTLAYADARLQGDRLLTQEPLFTQPSNQSAEYIGESLLIRHEQHLVWAIWDKTQKMTRFIPLSFMGPPPDPATVVSNSPQEDSVKHSFNAAGCRLTPEQSVSILPVAARPTNINVIAQQSIQDVSVEAVGGYTNGASSTPRFDIFLQFQNNSRSSFAFLPNRVHVISPEGQRVTAQFDGDAYSNTVYPGGKITGRLSVFFPWKDLGAKPLKILIPEATSGGRQFIITVSPGA